MRLVIDQHPHDFEPLREFRTRFDLPDEFSVNFFQPKSYDGLGSIERAGAALNDLKRAVLEAVPAHLTTARVFSLAADLTAVFQREMERINTGIGLRQVEIDFAASGFADVMQAYAYAAVLNASEPNFEAVYAHWLDQTVRIASPVIEYSHGDQVWGVQIIAHAYGRTGLIIAAETATYYVYDPALACPAEGFMVGLLRDVCAAVSKRLSPV